MPNHIAPDTTPDDALRVVQWAFVLANAAVISDIETGAQKIERDGRIWWDTRPMTDPREHSPICVDMAQQAIDYALHSGLAHAHPVQTYLLLLDARRTLDKRHLQPANHPAHCSLLRFALDILDPEMYGHAVPAEVRNAARAALGMPVCGR